MPITIIRWVAHDEAADLPSSCGGLGGFVKPGMRWSDYLINQKIEDHPYLEVLRKPIVDERLWITGEKHQESMCPVFSDETVGRFSFRAWGDFMAALVNEIVEGAPYGYMDFYYAYQPANPWKEEG